jgi:hypothetical protein
MQQDGGDEEPSLVSTVAEKLSAVRPEPTTELEEAPRTSEQPTRTLTPDDAMRADELLRNRLFLKVACGLAAFLGVGVALLSDRNHRRVVVAGLCALVVIMSLGFLRLFRDERNYTQGRWLLFDVCYVQPARPGRLTELDEDVDRVLALGLAKKQEERLAEAGQLVEALLQAVTGRLDARLRQRADALFMAQPWDSRPAP